MYKWIPYFEGKLMTYDQYFAFIRIFLLSAVSIVCQFFMFIC